ncbi:MAG: hypothetical protein PHZ26_03490 [Candidatus Gracilibacteria bacterium]|nr:hypothetical protein [Candidatus Gracilibacteria bacterium]MDD2908790.1 hypothetical protein [Candidatus Gracilibacteria bacterium]
MAQVLDKTSKIVLLKLSVQEYKKINESGIFDDDKNEQLLKLAEDTEVNGVEFRNSKEMFKFLNK